MNGMKIRFIAVIGGASLAFVFVIATLFNLQISKGLLFAQRAQAQRAIGGMFAAERGSIFLTDKNGAKIPAAVNKEYAVIFAVPTELDDAREATHQIAALLGLDENELLPRLSKEKDQYEELVAKASDEQALAAKEAGIKGLYVGSQRGRYYPFTTMAAQVLGFVSGGDEESLPSGQYGIEARHNKTLTGTADSFSDDRELVVGKDGEDVQLTIDQNIQVKSEQIIKSVVEEKKAIGGTVIVQDPQSGAILAMANYPTFDPNDFRKSPLEHFINPAVQGLYEPGSVFKPITMAIGIDTGVITPQTTFYDAGFFTADGKTIKNWDLKAHGLITMTNVIEQSINTGTVFAEKKIGHKTFYNYLLKFGLKELTGIGLPGEVAGRLTPMEKYPRDINFATASYGQGLSTTPIRLITAISAIASGGLMRTPYITEQEKTGDVRRVISESAAKQVTAMMVSAVKKAKVAAIPNYLVAGKTGTAFKPDFKNGGYSDKVINTYVGFAPATNARFTVLIKLDEPENAPLAGTTVVPAFHELAEFLLNYYNVAPDDI
jgi:cell division protein FtsI/penicillin-binding protein 2